MGRVWCSSSSSRVWDRMAGPCTWLVLCASLVHASDPVELEGWACSALPCPAPPLPACDQGDDVQARACFAMCLMAQRPVEHAAAVRGWCHACSTAVVFVAAELGCAAQAAGRTGWLVVAL
ncbi:hypothetical protein V8C86DRAFT_693297 [Haematococcus lacustris]